MTTWTPFTLAVVTNALPSDMGQLYANWITAHPEKANRLAEIVEEVRRTFRDAVSTNPRTLMDPETDTVRTVSFCARTCGCGWCRPEGFQPCL